MRFIDRRNCKSAFEKGESREIKSMGALTQEAVKIAEQNGLGVMQNRGGAFRVIRACGLGAYEDFFSIFGHNMRNGTMFSSLREYLNEGRLSSDPTILLEMEDGAHEFIIFAVACVDKLDSWYSFINAESEDAFNEAVQRIIQNAYFTNGDAPEYGDRLLTLSTCYGSTRSSRLIIIAKEENANVWKTESADAGTDGGNSDEGLLRYDIARLREILVRPLCCWRQLPICMGYPRISPLH